MIPQAVDDAPSLIVFTHHLLRRGMTVHRRNRISASRLLRSYFLVGRIRSRVGVDADAHTDVVRQPMLEPKATARTCGYDPLRRVFWDVGAAVRRRNRGGRSLRRRGAGLSVWRHESPLRPSSPGTGSHRAPGRSSAGVHGWPSFALAVCRFR